MEYGWNKKELMGKKRIYFDIIAKQGIELLNMDSIDESI